MKFTDAELIGIPLAVVVGRRFAEGYVELRDRATGERVDMSRRDGAEAIATRMAFPAYRRLSGSGVPVTRRHHDGDREAAMARHASR